jgi:uncharacterized damage-inducible protein DinB
MVEQPINLLSFYKGWDVYQALLIKALKPLSSDQLSLRVAPHLRSVGENVAHIISGRVSNFLVLGEGGVEIALLETWDEPGAPPRSAAELNDVFEDADNGTVSRFTRQWIIWNTIKHDLHHGGEVSLTLGTYHIEALDL